MPTWIKLEDTMPEHYKYLGLSDNAYATQIRAICYSSRLETDGYIPEQALAHLTRLGPEDELRPEDVVAELIANEIWHMANEICHDVPSGYVIHDFDQYQQTKVDKDALSKKRARAGALGAKARWQTDGKSSGLPDGNMASDGREEKIREEKKREEEPKNTRVEETFQEFWDLYPPRKGKKLGKGKAEAAWKRLSSAHRDEALSAVRNYAGACNRGDTLAKDAFRWLQDRAFTDWLTQARAEVVHLPEFKPEPGCPHSQTSFPCSDCRETNARRAKELISAIRERQA